MLAEKSMALRRSSSCRFSSASTAAVSTPLRRTDKEPVNLPPHARQALLSPHHAVVRGALHSECRVARLQVEAIGEPFVLLDPGKLFRDYPAHTGKLCRQVPWQDWRGLSSAGSYSCSMNSRSAAASWFSPPRWVKLSRSSRSPPEPSLRHR